MKKLLSFALLLSFLSYSNAQKKKVLNKDNTKIEKVKKSSGIEPVKSKINVKKDNFEDNSNHPRYEYYNLLIDRFSSQFTKTDNYPSNLNNPRNGNEVVGVYKNNNGVYMIRYNANNEKQYRYYTNETVTMSEFEMFSMMIEGGVFKQININSRPVFQEMGIKRMDGAVLTKLEKTSGEFSKGKWNVWKGTYTTTDGRTVYAYSDGNNWLVDGVFSSSGH
ncbi:MAG: hypothetical protein WBF83_06930 [Moheibacter sp.]